MADGATYDGGSVSMGLDGRINIAGPEEDPSGGKGWTTTYGASERDKGNHKPVV